MGLCDEKDMIILKCDNCGVQKEFTNHISINTSTWHLEMMGMKVEDKDWLDKMGQELFDGKTYLLCDKCNTNFQRMKTQIRIKNDAEYRREIQSFFKVNQ